MTRGKKIGLGVGAVVLAGLAYAGFRFGPDLITAQRNGFFERVEKVEYTGTTKDNLKAIHTALMLYHESEGAFPPAEGWMDAIMTRLNTADLKPGEAEKKLRDPSLAEGEYGFALNRAAAGKYKDDIPGGATAVLIFASTAKGRSASGDPTKDARGPLAIRVDGTLSE